LKKPPTIPHMHKVEGVIPIWKAKQN
jgi:hypothetical protein